MSIRLKLTIMFLAIALIPLLLVSTITFTNYKNSLEASRLSQLRDLVTFKTASIEAYLAGLKADIEIVQNSYLVKKNIPVLTRLANNPVDPEFLTAKKMLDDVLRKTPSVLGLSDIMLVNPEGKVVYSSNPKHYPKDFLNMLPDSQQKAFEEGKNKIYFSDVFFNKSEGDKSGLLITAPAFDLNGAFIGVIALEVDTAHIYRLIQDVTGLGDTGETLVGQKIGNQVVFLNPLRHDPEAVLKRKINIGEKVGGPMQEAVQGREGAGQLVDYRGKKVIAAWRYIPSLDWGIVAKIDTQEAFADVVNLRNLLIILLVILSVLAGIMAFSIAQSISEPIKKLSKGAEIIGSGNLEYKIGTNLKDEIGQLSRSFDKMTRDLKQTTASRDELNKEIAERKRAEKALHESREDLNHAQAVGNIGSWRLDVRRNELTWSDENHRIFGIPKGTPMAYETFLSTVHPDDRDYVDTKWKEGLAGEPYDIEHRIIVDGQVKWVREKAYLEYDSTGALVGGFGITQNITDRKQMEEKLRKSRGELEIRVQQRTAALKEVVEALQVEMAERKQAVEKLKTTNALLSLFSQKSSRKEYLDAVVDLVHSWTGCRCVGIRILDDNGYIPYESYVGFSREFWESENRLSIEHDQCACIRVVTGNADPQDGLVMTPGGSFHCDDYVAFVGRLSAEEKARFRGVCIQNGFLSLNVVPIRYGKKVLGTIHLADEEGKKISLPFIEFLESMSPLIGEAVNRFDLKDEIRNSESHLRFLSSQLLSVQEDERKRISAELHDDIAAKLAAIKFSLEKNLMHMGNADDEVNQSLKSIISMVLETIASTRRIMVNLRPAIIDDLGILATLNWYCREFEQIFDTIHVEKQANIEEIEIPDHLKIVIFRIVQEGLNNIAKHSGANNISLVLEKTNDTLGLLIEDNGRGFDVANKILASETFQGFGIVNMKERARLSGGEFSIKSFQEKGTSIKVTWSLKPIAMDYHLRIEPS